MEDDLHQGDFDEWFTANFKNLVESLRHRMSGTEYTASDAVMSAYLSLHAAEASIENPMALVRVVAVRKYQEHLRRRSCFKDKQPSIARPVGVTVNSANAFEAKEVVDFLRDNLTARERVIFEGRLSRLTFAEVAQRLHQDEFVEGCTPDHARYLWNQLLASMQQRLDDVQENQDLPPT